MHSNYNMDVLPEKEPPTYVTYPILHTGFASVCLSQDDGSRIYFSRVPHTVFEARGLAHLNLHLESTNFRQTF
jgi:hypothetical protein